jgi:hypothetical protein
VLVHGANAVCGVPAPRSDGAGHIAIVLSVLVALGFAWALTARRGSSPGRVALLLAAAVLIAAPGLRAVWVDRADAPLRAAAGAQQVGALVNELDGFAHAHRDCLEAVENDCEECQPIVRFVLPVHTTCARPEGRIVLRSDALGNGCVASGDTLICGRAPRDSNPVIASQSPDPRAPLGAGILHVSSTVSTHGASASPAVVSHVTTGASPQAAPAAGAGTNATM